MIFNLFNKSKKNENNEEFSSSSCDKLLKKATEKKRSGNLEEAIELLKKAYDVGASEMSIQNCLRLPLYLQQAKKNDEGWGILCKLLAEGWPGGDKFMVHADRAAIYNKMSLFRKREKNFDDALAYGLMSYLEDLNLCYSNMKNDEIRQKEFEEYELDMSSSSSESYWGGTLKHRTSDDSINREIKKLLKKSSYEDKFNDIFNLVKRYTKQIPKNNFSIFEDLEKLKN
jgi:hypothetical protein|tara:strand:- start:577 stop:1260 length:684 start_codon:yes stop_codon:yes gene_type:complete